MQLLNQVIESDRLKLIPVSEKYCQIIFEEFTDEITVFMFPKTPDKTEEIMNFIKSSREKMEHGQEFQLVILNKNTDEFLGVCGVEQLNTDMPELGVWIKKNSHGNKYGREAVYALKKWVDNNFKYKYLIYPVDRKNLSSRKVAESLGGVIGNKCKKVNMAGKILDEIEYRIYPNK